MAKLSTSAYLDIKELCITISMSKSWVYKAIADKKFPAPVSVSPGARRWVVSEIEDWMRNRQLERDAAK